VAGGTDLFPNMKRRQFEPKCSWAPRIRELTGIRGSAREGVTLGAGTTLSTVAATGDRRALRSARDRGRPRVSPQLRNMGTLGGNVCVDTRCNYYNQSHEWRKAIASA